jgi:hypothetical protein
MCCRLTSGHQQFICFMLAKARRGERWRQLFVGDSDGSRCMDMPVGLQRGCIEAKQQQHGCPAAYHLVQGSDEVVMELQV